MSRPSFDGTLDSLVLVTAPSLQPAFPFWPTRRYITLKTNFLQKCKEHKAELARNEELGLEVLHLANMKVVLMRERDA